MSRTTRAELDELAAMINRRLDTDAYAIGYAYGSPRLERDGGARDVSPRLPAGQLADWMRAFLAGIDAGRIPWERSDEDSVNGTVPGWDGAGAAVEAQRG